MLPKWLRALLLLPLVAAGISGCANPNAAAPGVQTAAAAAPQAGFTPGEGGRVVSVREIAMRGGSRGSGMGQGTLMGGLLGGGAGATIGSSVAHTVGGGLIGAVLGVVGGAIIGTIVDRQGGNVGRGIEVVVQKDDGQTVTIAQQDDGDVQLGDRVTLVADQGGNAKAVRDTTRRSD